MSPEMDNYRIPRQRQPHARVSLEEQFARLVEVESVAAARSSADPGLARLLSVTGALRTATVAAGPLPLPAASKAAMRQRLVAVATVSALEASEAAAVERLRRRHTESVTARVHRRLVALAGSFAVVTSVAGVGVAAAHSLPGDPFYGVKRATESVQLWATHGEAAKGKLHLEFARTRLAEAEKLPANSSYVASTLAAMNSQTKQGSTELISAYRSSGSTKPLATLVTFTQHQYAGLSTLAPHLSPALQGTELTALTVLTDVTNTVRTVTGQSCLTCLLGNGTAPPGTNLTPTPHRTTPAPSPSPQPSKSASRGVTGRRHTPTPPTPTKTPGSLLPTKLLPSGLLPSLLPSNLQPSSLLPKLLGGDHKSKPKSSPSPLPLVSNLLKTLGL